MAARYANWYRKRFDEGVTSAQEGLGRKLLGILMEQLRLARLPTGTLRHQAVDGTLYVASFDGTTPIVRIVPVPSGSQEEPTPPVELWIPAGFVFTPGNNVSGVGFGLPVQLAQTAPTDVFDPANVDPGLDVQRWTAGGACGQVLVTQQDTTKYPDPKRRHLPIAFDPREWVTDAWTAPPNAAWHAIRARFNDFGWSSDVMGARRDLWNALAAAQVNPVALPFAGYYDGAQLIADLGTGYGTDPTQWPLHYQTETERESADGIPTSYQEAWTNLDTATLASELGAAATGCPNLDAGDRSGLHVATLRGRDAWIEAGNLFWHPADGALPTLSWDGYPAQNLPDWLVSGALQQSSNDLLTLEQWFYYWRGTEQRAVFSRNLYAMGRRIGVLPATVISAAIHTRVETVSGQATTIDQLRVVTWEAADQWSDASAINYFYGFRVWFLDCPRFADVPLRLTDLPNGAYDATTNPTGWHAAGLFTVADDPSAGTTAWQQWRFSPDGTRLIAAAGSWGYAADWGQDQYALEVVLSEVSEGTLGWTRSIVVPVPTGGSIAAADYDVNGQPVWVWERLTGNPDQPAPPDGAMDGVFGMFFWSGGGDGEVTQWAGLPGAPQVPDKWVLSARDGALILTDHWFECVSNATLGKYQVRMARKGVRVATYLHDDTFLSALGAYNDAGWLSDLNASYGCDRDGNWLLGYDLGVSAGSSVVYSPAPTCDQAYSTWTIAGCTTSGHTASRWLASFGDVQTMVQMQDGDLRAYPVGVV